MGLIWSDNQTSSTSCEGKTDIKGDPTDEEKSEDRQKNVQDEIVKFKEEFEKKREVRREALSALGKRMADLRLEKEKEQEEKEILQKKLENMEINNDQINNRLKQLEEKLKLEKEEKEKWMLEAQCAKHKETEKELETIKSEEVVGLERQVKALKDVAGISAEMLRIRELQVNELKTKLTAIEETGQAYEKEVENMRRLRALYEERARAISLSHKMELDREKARLVASEAKLELAEQRIATLEERKSELNETVNKMDTALDAAKAEISELRLELAGNREELYNATSQMSIINQLFSQVLSGPDGLERVTRVLEEHHDLVNHLTEKGKINDLASTLLELADQGHTPTEEEQDIAANLGKVWRLLVELLGHHVKPTSGDSSPNSCYKSIDTPKGPKLVISVSQTFLRLKDLILEKNSLVKEVGRLKELNSTLESRLVEQESRLSVVAEELHKTWDVVSRLKTQHKHLHTHEKVLRYELAQKRLMLNQLKKELENCKESWELARAKNSQTEEDWRELRKEFASRKQISSAESGYEESPGDSQDEEDWSAREEAETEDRSERDLSEKADIPGKPDTSEKEHNSEKEDLSEKRDEFGKESVCEKENDLEKDPNDCKTSTVEMKNNQSSSTTTEVEACTKTEPLVKEGTINPAKPRTAEEILKAREDRLKRLEEQCKGLFSKMNQTSQRSDLLSNRLVELHEHYGEESRQKKHVAIDESQPTTTSEIMIPSSSAVGTTYRHDEQSPPLMSSGHPHSVFAEATKSSENTESSHAATLPVDIISLSAESTLKLTPDLDPDPKT